MSHSPGLKQNDHYIVLGLSPDATDDEIRAAYKKLALKWHPDRHAVDKERAAQMFIEVNAAYRALMDGKETIHSKSAEDTAKSASGSDGHSTHSSSKRGTHSKSSAGKDHETSSNTSASPEPSQSSTSPDSEFGTKNTHSSTAKPSSKPSSKSSYSGSSRSSKTQNTHSRSKHDYPFSMPSHAAPSESQSTNSSRKNGHSSSNKDDRQTRSASSRHHHGSAHTSASSASPPSGHHSEKNTDTHPPSSHTHFSATSTAIPPAESGASVRSKTSRTRTNVSNSSKPVIPPVSQLHKPSRFGFGDDFVQKLSKGKPKTPKRRKAEDGCDPEDEGAPVYGSPLRPLISPRGSSKEWIFPLPLTLDDMYHGTNFRFRIIREMLSRQKKEVEIEIDIPPGCRSGTRIVCPGTGHERKDGTLQDVVFLVEEVSHDRFSRVKDDLFLDICVPWVDSLADEGGELCVEGLDGEEITFPLPYPIQDQATEGKIIIKQAGMPVLTTGKAKGRGDLIIRWQVVFSNPSKWQSLKKVFHLKA